MYDWIMPVAMASSGAGGQTVGQGSGLTMLVPMLIIFAIFYFMLIRPQQRKEKERRKMIADVQSGSRVMFSGGIIGTITNSKEHTFTVKIAENVKIEIARSAVNRVLEKDEKPGKEENA